MAEATNKTIQRKFRGLVVSDKMDKTRVVKVESVKVHPKYRKRYFVSKKLRCTTKPIGLKSATRSNSWPAGR